MKSTKRIIALGAALSISMLSVSGVAGAAPAPTPVQQALGLAAQRMVVPTKILQTVPLKSKPPTGLNVVFMNNGTASTQLIAQGVEEGAKALGWTYQSMSYSGSNLATLQAAMMNALATRPAGVMLAGVNSGAWGESVTQAYAEAKVPIIIGSTCPAAPVGPIFPGGSTCANNGPIGKALADWFIADSGGKGHILIESMPFYAVYVVWLDAFKAEVARLCPDCKIDVIEVTPAQFAAGQITGQLVSKLRSDPSITYLFYDNAAWSAGILPALDSAGILDRVKVGGQALDANSLAALKNHQEVVWSANAYPIYGYADIDSLARILTKSSGMTKNSAMPFQLVTSVNAGSVTLPYTEPANALEQYKKMWKVS
ncbi:MAG: substrate-binding domain-containing protein [Actinobacteria bacterium]|uniref:Unannotated protein n=1 Tax=freshwater metagenome TaxID=449393 RepID=A0A6J7LPX4_9ZZZZ|nr:substrate-binding domain-containing protein [Actinomycetota bacterium]